MEYELLTHRGLQPNPKLGSKQLLYFYSRMRKDREESAQREAMIRSMGGKKIHRMGS